MFVGRIQNDGRLHRPQIDHTFNAP